MKITIYDYPNHGNKLEYEKVDKITEVGVSDLCDDRRRGIAIYLNIDYAIEKGTSYLQFINCDDYSRIEIH